jgi:glycosyltransferase involved in cell wall biosynthesis
MTPVLSLIVAEYNKPEQLRLVLAACRRQTLKDFELVVADDGSGPDVAAAIDAARHRCAFPVAHLRHQDAGWRKNTMLNKAIRAASADYLVFIDGDCLPHGRFIEDHFSAREVRKALCGRRCDMSERWTRSLTHESVESGEFERLGAREWLDGITGRALHVENGLRFRSEALARLFHPAQRGMLGCNFSAWKSDMESINGFDELYDGPGFGEDTDVEFRLGLAGVRCKPLRQRAVLFHLHHPRTAVSPASAARFLETKRRNSAWSENGLSTSPPPGERIASIHETAKAGDAA